MRFDIGVGPSGQPIGPMAVCSHSVRRLPSHHTLNVPTSTDSARDTQATPLTPRTPPPIFVGGTGRSGTTILGRLLGKHSDYTVIPVEAKFHCSPDGLPGVLLGTESPEEFARRVVNEWFHPPGQTARLAAFVNPAALDVALARFLARAVRDPVAAGRGLVQELFGGYARSQDRYGWVEMTPINAMWGAPQLAILFPELRLVNVIRDGRDVVGSLIAMGWMDNAPQALAWWEERMLRGHRQLETLPVGSVLTVQFERLLVYERERGLRDLFAFMGWVEEEEDSMLRFFERRMPPEDAHVGRWETDFHGQERELLATEYDAVLSRLRTAGVPVPETSPTAPSD
jgi:Sulfotransferase family